MDEPIQIISFDETKKLKLNTEKLERILNQEHIKKLPIVIISVVGAYRTGKSFLLSWLIRYLKSDHKDSNWLQECRDDEPLLQGFKWRSGSNPETQGIWAWSEIFVVTSSSGQQIGVMLIDTQGLFDGNNTIQQNGNIFTLSTLISSTQIFNLSHRIQEDSLRNLQLFAEFGRLALTRGQLKNDISITPFQRIVFLIRDWQSPKQYPYGSQGGRNRLEDYMNVTNEREGNELGETRKHIRRCFSDVDCYLMPYPGEKVANDEDDFDGRLSDMADKFKDHLEKLMPFLIFPNDGKIQQKTVAGSQILAADVINYVESYVNLLNSDQGLSPESIFEATAKVHNNTVARDALEVYKENFIKIADSNKEILLLLSDQEIEMYHEDFKKKAFEYFEEHQMSNGSDLNSGILSEDIEEIFEHWKKRNELIRVEIMNLNELVMHNAHEMYTTAMDDWFKSNINATTPYFSMEQLSEQHQKVQDKIANVINNQWKGPDVIKRPLQIRLQEFMHGQFVNVVVVRNEEKKRQEEARLELIRVENERAEFQVRMEEEERRRRAVEEEAARQATEAERQRIELEAQMRLQEMNANHEIEMAKLRAAEAEERAAAAAAAAAQQPRRRRRGVWVLGKRIM